MRRRLVAALAGGALLLGACGGTPAAGPETPASGPAPTPSPSSPGVTEDPASSPPEAADGAGHELLAFEAPLLDGGTFDGAVSGDVVVWFWAPW